NREKNSIENFKNINNSLYDVGWKSQFFAGIIMPLMTFIGNIGYVVIAVVGGYFVTKRLITIGDIQAFIQYSHQFTQPIIGIANIVNLIQSTIASAERVFEVLDENEQSPDPAFPVDLRDVKGQIDFDRVYFSYDPEKKLIENI
ncbi:MAG TPA: ABC transporter transmembrane domain-containing protein, partial [Exilispira sp.]|nr:ABC transporter transmembrane domain-containing protein [Exilispira sp.]